MTASIRRTPALRGQAGLSIGLRRVEQPHVTQRNCGRAAQRNGAAAGDLQTISGLRLDARLQSPEQEARGKTCEQQQQQGGSKHADSGNECDCGLLHV